MNLDNTYTIYKDNYGRYKIGLSHKTMDGKREYAYFLVKFKKDVELENKTNIKIHKYWLDFYNWEKDEKKGTTFYIFINEFDKVETQQNTIPQSTPQQNEDIWGNPKNIEIDSSELPFY